MAAEPGRRAASFALLARLLGVTVLTTFAAPAAASPSDAELKAARDLFAEAEKDEDTGRWSDALDKLHRVADVKLTSGVRYHLALCEEHLGHLVAALDAFAAAQAQARADGARDVLRLVGKHLDDLGPRVPRLTVRVLPGDAAATVKLDGNALPPSALGAPIAVDPGVHQLEASAEPRTPTSATVTLQERDVTSIDLKLGEPVVAPLAIPAPPPSPTPAPATPAPLPPEARPAAQVEPAAEGGTHTGALVATAGAVVLAAGGALAFVLAGNAVTTGEQQCAAQRGPCDPERNTVRAWDFTAAGAWIGAAAVGTVAVLLWTQPQTPGAEPVRARLVVGPTSAGVWGQF